MSIPSTWMEYGRQKAEYHSRISMEKHIIQSVDSKESIILRYSKTFEPEIDRELLRMISIGEGCRIAGPFELKGVNLYVLDMASLMADGNFKSTVACVAIARSVEQGVRGLVVCSSGNTGVAIARYSRQIGLPAHIFIPKMSSYKFDYSVVDENLHTVEVVDAPEWQVHSQAKSFAERNGFLMVPTIQHQLESNACRALFVLEYMLENNIAFDWTSQAISGGHGPVGFYKKLYSLFIEGYIPVTLIPGFIGIQQDGISPMYNAWSEGRDYIVDSDVNLYPVDVLEPTLYCTRPEKNYKYLYDVIRANGGAFYAIGIEEYNRLEQTVLGIFRENGLKLRTRDVNGRRTVSERAGILSGIGILKAIEEGRIHKGQNALITFTGSTGHASMPKLKIV